MRVCSTLRRILPVLWQVFQILWCTRVLHRHAQTLLLTHSMPSTIFIWLRAAAHFHGL